MPAALTEAALDCLTPTQRDALRADQAGDLMRLMVDTSEKVGRIAERQPAVVALDKPAQPQAAEKGRG